MSRPCTPKVHGGLLARRDDESHVKALRDNDIEYIDLVCVNLYPFRRTIEREGVEIDEAIENIDIGGPSMLRSAAKNYRDVTVVCDPSDYGRVLEEIRAGGNTAVETRMQLSAKAYTHTAEYDMCIAGYMRSQAGLSEKLFLDLDLKQELRYGENPHQSAKFFASGDNAPYSLATARQLHGKEMSYNNIQDANAALNIVAEFDEPFCVGLKHMNPCGAAVGRDIAEAWRKAYEADKVSIFGGIVACNREITAEAAEATKPVFPRNSHGAVILARGVGYPHVEEESASYRGRHDPRRQVAQTVCRRQRRHASCRMPTRPPSVSTRRCALRAAARRQAETADADFAWRIVKHVKSNAIVVVRDGHTVGVGAGQMNRVGSAGIALEQAAAAGFRRGSRARLRRVLPFDDTVTLAGRYGVTTLVQPGGSVRDEDSLKRPTSWA